MRPWTSYPFESRNSARYEPSWPVIPVISARGAIVYLFSQGTGRIKDRGKREDRPFGTGKREE
jgi:hypothetical protein